MALLSRISEKLENRLSLAEWAWRGSITAMSIGLPAWAAHATAWVNAYGPIAWVIAGALGAAAAIGLICASNAVLQKIHRDSVRRKFYDRADNINPLQDMFDHKRIKISELIPPYTNIIENKTFVECEIIGPQNVFFSGTASGSLTINGCHFLNCAGFVTKDNIGFPNIIGFVNCSFLRCTMANLMIFMPDRGYQTMAAGLSGLPWLTPGYPKDLPASPPPSPAPPQPQAGTLPQTFP
jgi:hypothetical protein